MSPPPTLGGTQALSLKGHQAAPLNPIPTTFDPTFSSGLTLRSSSLFFPQDKFQAPSGASVTSHDPLPWERGEGLEALEFPAPLTSC